MISFKVTKEERATIDKIVERAILEEMAPDRIELAMDLAATHSNGCPLDFEKLLAFDSFNFAHDIYGIRRHIDRRTAQLLNFFVPRCARSCAATAAAVKKMGRAA